MKHAVHWSICLLHFNELPLRHLFEAFDGVTTGPRSFSGPIGKQIQSKIHLNPVVAFEAVGHPDNLLELHDDVANNLSQDQQLLYRYCQAITSGHISDSLSCRIIGPVNHSRWLTSAIRMLRLYMNSDDPSNELKRLVNYIVMVYAPMWFSIRYKSSRTEGARHLFSFIRLCDENLNSNEQKIVCKVIQNNAYFAHHENVLLTMLSDENKANRRQAVKLIIDVRKKRTDQHGVRLFKLPSVNFDCNSFYSMITWNPAELTEPPVTKKLQDQELIDIIGTPLKLHYPCHTTSVERGVKLVTEASAKVLGKDHRQKKIIATLSSRKKTTKFESKKDFN